MKRTPPPCEMNWFEVNVFGNFALVDEVGKIMLERRFPASVVLSSTANSIVPKLGSEGYDASKAATNDLVRELAIG